MNKQVYYWTICTAVTAYLTAFLFNFFWVGVADTDPPTLQCHKMKRFLYLDPKRNFAIFEKNPFMLAEFHFEIRSLSDLLV